MAGDHFDVVVIGCGPVGMILASLLANEGVSVLAIERHSEVGYRPRARHLDGEAMRVLQTIGVAERCEDVMPAFGGGLRLIDAAGRTMLEQKFDAVKRGSQGWFDDYQMFQPLLLALLDEHLQASDTGSTRLLCEATAVTQESDHARVDLINRDTGSSEHVTASYVVGCDGAGSMVRGQVESTLQSLGPDHPFAVIDATPVREGFSLPDPTYSNLVCNPRRPHYVSPGHGPVPIRFEFMVLPDDDAEEMVTPAGVARLTQPYVSEGDVRIDRAAVYVFHSLILDRWRVGRVLLAGDAAHVQPPFLGQGLCSGVRDASNLAWKLAMVCHGRASERLLDTYQSERGPHARDWIIEANRIGGIVMTTDVAEAEARDRSLLAGEFRGLRPITPHLGPGLSDDPTPPVGSLAPQPVLGDGRRLDDVVGSRFVIAATGELWDELSPALSEAVDSAAHAVVLSSESKATASLLAHYDCGAVVVRPDRYVLGVADSVPALDRLIRTVSSVLREPSSP